MAMLPAFQWSGGKAVSPDQLARARKIAEALRSTQQNPQTLWQGVQSAIGQIGGTAQDLRADEQEKVAREAYGTDFMALGDAPTREQLMSLAGNDFGSPGQQAVVQALLAQQLTPPKSPDPFTLGKGDRRFAGDGSLIAEGIADSPDMVIENNIGGTDKYYDELDKGLAGQTVSAIDAKRNAQSNNARLGQLETLLKTAPQGAQGVVTQFAGSIGIPLEGLDELQASQAIINQMVPGQRPPGSGTMSDADLDLFKKSLPSIANQPGGNTLILQTAKAINEYTIEQGRIAEMVANREISPAKGRELQAAIPNPLANIKSAAPAPSKYPGVTIEAIPD